jgi:UDP-GlcNAc:undecaprenyl-phosphate GlcNAc-1-phosphate transferase
VGITNAFNLLDNMDGLAAGIALIAAGILSYFFLSSGDIALSAVSLCLAGAVAGFLIYNFPPASIFMGDSGSLFLGSHWRFWQSPANPRHPMSWL